MNTVSGRARRPARTECRPPARACQASGQTGGHIVVRSTRATHGRATRCAEGAACETVEPVATTAWLKLGLAPALILIATLAGRRWGPAVGGWLAGLPLTSGPVSFILALEQGPEFAARAALGTLFGLVSLASFCLAYGAATRRAGWPACLVAALGAFAASTLVFRGAALPLGLAFAFVCAVLAGVGAAPGRRRSAATPASPSPRRPGVPHGHRRPARAGPHLGGRGAWARSGRQPVADPGVRGDPRRVRAPRSGRGGGRAAAARDGAGLVRLRHVPAGGRESARSPRDRTHVRAGDRPARSAFTAFRSA